MRSFLKVQSWLKRKRFSIIFSIITLLHECGHLIQYLQRKQNKRKHVANVSWKTWHQILALKSKRRLEHSRLSIIEEEFLAWELGLKLANRLSIRIPLRSWNYHRVRAMNTYLRAGSF